MQTLKNLVLLDELSKKTKISRLKLKMNFAGNLVVIKNKTYINKDVLNDEIKSITTNLDNYLPLSLFSDLCGIKERDIKKRIDFMKRNNTKIFEFMELNKIFYIKVDDELLNLIETHKAFLCSYGCNDFEHMILFGDFKIGFWK